MSKVVATITLGNEISYFFFFFFLNPIYIPRESGNKLRTPEATTGEM